MSIPGEVKYHTRGICNLPRITYVKLEIKGESMVLYNAGEPQNHLQERTAQDRARPTGGAATAAQEGEGLQSIGGRVYHHTAQTGRL